MKPWSLVISTSGTSQFSSAEFHGLQRLPAVDRAVCSKRPVLAPWRFSRRSWVILGPFLRFKRVGWVCTPLPRHPFKITRRVNHDTGVGFISHPLMWELEVFTRLQHPVPRWSTTVPSRSSTSCMHSGERRDKDDKDTSESNRGCLTPGSHNLEGWARRIAISSRFEVNLCSYISEFQANLGCRVRPYFKKQWVYVWLGSGMAEPSSDYACVLGI